MKEHIKWTMLYLLTCFLLTGCRAHQRREAVEQNKKFKTKVELLEQQVNTHERRLDKLEDQVTELSK
jgi:hypothetical protein